MTTSDDHIRALDVEAAPIDFLWADRIPLGMFSLIVGRPDLGKSLLSVFLAAETSRRGHGVIFSNVEDSPSHVLRPRLEAAGANLSRVHFWHPTLPKDIELLEKKIIDLKARLVVMDPMSAHLTTSIYNDQEVRRSLTPLTAMAARRNCAIIGVHHTIKNIGNHPLAAVGGSGGGLPAAARVIFAFGLHPDNEDERVLAPIKFNIGVMPKSVTFEMDEQSFTITKGKKTQDITAGRLGMLDDEAEISAMKVLMASQGNLSAEKKAAAAEWLTELLCDGAKKSAEIQQAANLEGIAWRTLRRAADDIGVVKVRQGGGVGSWVEWDLPDDHPLRTGGV